MGLSPPVQYNQLGGIFQLATMEIPSPWKLSAKRRENVDSTWGLSLEVLIGISGHPPTATSLSSSLFSVDPQMLGLVF